jgi:hypothetical protein
MSRCPLTMWMLHRATAGFYPAHHITMRTPAVRQQSDAPAAVSGERILHRRAVVECERVNFEYESGFAVPYNPSRPMGAAPLDYVSSRYRVSASLYIGRHTSLLMHTTSAAITIVESSSTLKLPASLAAVICAPRPRVESVSFLK